MRGPGILDKHGIEGPKNINTDIDSEDDNKIEELP